MPGCLRVCLNNRVCCGVVGLQVCSCAPWHAGAWMCVWRCRLSPERCACAPAGSPGAPGGPGAGAPGQQGAAGAGSQAGGSGAARDAAGGEGAAGPGPDSEARGAGGSASGGAGGGDARGPGFAARVRAFAEVVRHEVRPAPMPWRLLRHCAVRRGVVQCAVSTEASSYVATFAAAAGTDLVSAPGRARKARRRARGAGGGGRCGARALAA